MIMRNSTARDRGSDNPSDTSPHPSDAAASPNSEPSIPSDPSTLSEPVPGITITLTGPGEGTNSNRGHQDGDTELATATQNQLTIQREPYGYMTVFREASERRPIERDYSLPGMEHELSLLGRCFVCNDTGIMGQPCRRCDHGSTYVDMADEDEWSYHNPTPPRYVHGSWTTETPSPRSDDTPPDGTNTRSPWMGEVTITNPQEPEGSEQNPIELLGEEDAKEELLFHSSDDEDSDDDSSGYQDSDILDVYSAEEDDEEPELETNLHIGQGGIPKEWILLDNCSTINVFCNPKLLKNIRRAGKTMKIRC